MNNRRIKSGFTLIELLVVIAIIAILAAILFPVFAKAREKARQIVCLSNEKQLGIGVLQYNQDYDEYNPPGVNWFFPGGNGWAGQIYPYVKSTAVYVCPDEAVQGAQCSYAYNSNVTTPTGATVTAVSLAQYNSPSKTILLSEVQGNYAAGTVWSISAPGTAAGADAYVGSGSNGFSPAGLGTLINGLGFYTSPPSLKYATGYIRNASTQYYGQAADYYYASAAGRHSGGANYVMADGHAKFFLPAAVSGGSNNTTQTDCGAGTTNGSGYIMAAGTSCSDSTLGATYSVE